MSETPKQVIFPDGTTFWTDDPPIYEFDVTMGNLGDHMGRSEFGRLYSKHLADGWEPWGERELVVHQQEMRSKGIVQVGFAVMVAQVWRRKAKPTEPVQ